MGRRTPEHLGPATLPNRKCPFTSTAQEQAVRQEAAEAHLQVLRSQLPQILARLARIPDPRRQASVEHGLPPLRGAGGSSTSGGLASPGGYALVS